MPYRNTRVVNRGVQDEEDFKEQRRLEHRQRQAKRMKWWNMIGFTVVEFILCLVCLISGYFYYRALMKYQVYRKNKDQIAYERGATLRYIILPPSPMAIAGTFLTIAYVDLVGWHSSIRPISYFPYIMISTSGFLLFMLYSGVILFTTWTPMAIIAIVFGIITGIVYLIDMICMLLTLKRFPAPYYALRRRYEKFEKCTCTADYAANVATEEEREVDRPICRCGDRWGEPCICDNPANVCGCSAKQTGVHPCECCKCRERDVRLVDTTTESVKPIVEHFSSVVIQASTQVDNYQYCSRGNYCTDVPRTPPTKRSSFAKSPVSCTSPSRIGMVYNSATRSVLNTSGPIIATRPTGACATNVGGPELSKSFGAPNMSLAGRVPINKPISGGNSRVAYPVYSTTVDDEELVRDVIAARYHPEKKDRSGARRRRKSRLFHNRSAVDNRGEGDYVRRRAVSVGPAGNTEGDEKQDLEKEYAFRTLMETNQSASGHSSDSETCTQNNLPGQIITLDDTIQHTTKRNISVSARERGSSLESTIHSEGEVIRPRSYDVLRSPCLIRNVSTTVRAVKPLSRVTEADNEDENRLADRFPSESTFNIDTLSNKGK